MFHIAAPLIVADILQLLGSLVGLLVLVMWVIRQIVEANKQAGPPKGQPHAAPQPVQPQAQAQPRGMQQAGQQADPLRNQVEEFLRRAGRVPPGDRQAPAPRRARPAAANEIEVLIDEGAEPAERRSLAEPFRPMDQPAGPPRRTAASERNPRPPRSVSGQRHETVAEHVEGVTAHSRSLADQTSRLGQRIIEDDHQFDVQLKAKFDHTVGTLTGSGVAAAEQAAADADHASRPAAQIAAMLASPDGMRQAIVLNEILRRPSERW